MKYKKYFNITIKINKILIIKNKIKKSKKKYKIFLFYSLSPLTISLLGSYENPT